MTPELWTLVALQIGVMLFTAILLGNLARRMGLPPVVGELFGGVVVGPTLLGRIAPELQQWLFPIQSPATSARDAFARTGMLCFIVTIGLGISLNEFRRIGKTALLIGCVGTFVPFVLGFAVVYGFSDLMQIAPQNRFPVSTMMGAIISLSANPVIARILIDLGEFHTETGRIIMSATLIDDVVGWGTLALLVSEYGPKAKPGTGFQALGMVVGLIVVIIFAGRWLFPRILVAMEKRMPQPQGTLMWVIAITMLAAASTESLGVHSFLGAFLVGIALADVADRFKEPMHVLGQFSYAIFTTVFFVSMGIGTDFVRTFDLAIATIVTVVSFLGKISGVFIGGKIAGLSNRAALAIGCGMNARGILGIVMSKAAFDSQLITEKLFVGCLVMCMITTMFAGPALRWTLGKNSLAARGDDDSNPGGPATAAVGV